MGSTSTNPAAHDDRVLMIERIFDAPRDLVFKAWTEPERMIQWWGPRGYTMTSCEMDLRPGGAYLYAMRRPEGGQIRSQGVFREVDPPARLVLQGGWLDDNGQPGHQTTMTLTFDDLGGKTKLTLHQAVFESVEARDAHNNGWSSSFDCLADYLAAS